MLSGRKMYDEKHQGHHLATSVASKFNSHLRSPRELKTEHATIIHLSENKLHHGYLEYEVHRLVVHPSRFF